MKIGTKKQIIEIMELLAYSILPMIFWVSIIFGFDAPYVAVLTIISAVIHELGHYAAIAYFTKESAKVRPHASGFRIKRSSQLSYGKEIAILLAGPIANLVLFFLSIPLGNSFEGYARIFGYINLATGLSNLLPFEGYDGYGAAHNIAMREAIRLRAKYHIVINPDIYFSEGTIESLTKYMDNHKDIGWVMPKILYPSGEVQHLCKLLPTPYDLIIRRFLPKRLLGRVRDKFNPKISDRELNMPYLSGCFMFLRVSALRKVGLFDERFFMYGEDLDLSRRMHRQYKTIYYPGAAVVHAHRAESYHSGRMLWVHIENIAIYFNKWGWFFDPERRKVNKKVRREILKR